MEEKGDSRWRDKKRAFGGIERAGGAKEEAVEGKMGEWRNR